MDRLKNIDILKFISLFCIILAHVSPPNIIFQIRNFDVILMIIISVLLFINNSSEKKNLNYFSYLIKRIKRLLIPTYVFLVIFFLLAIFIKPYPFDLNTIVSSFILHDGIGYIWIIRIYLIIAVLIPIINDMIKKYSLNKVIFITLILYILYELLYYFGIFNINIFFEDIVAYLIPCISIIVLSYWINSKSNNNKKLFYFSIINLIVFILLAIVIYKVTGKIQNTNFSKYPFRLYYLSYAIGVSSILILIMRYEKIVDFLYNKFICFVSKSSMWIYLWHIFLIYIVRCFIPNFNWIIKYVIIVFLSCFITYIQNIIIDKFQNKAYNKAILQVFRG